MSTPQILYRQLDENYEPRWGQSKSDFAPGITAVGQAIMTRLKLFQAEWWSNLSDGLPLWQQILGVGGAGKNVAAISLLITQRILGTPFVLNVNNVQSSFNASTREFQYYAEVLTSFGVVVVTNYPTPPFQSLPPGV